MKKEKKEELKEQFVQLYLQGNTIVKIASLTGYSRNFIGKLIENDTRIKEYNNNKTVKVIKLKNRNQMNIPISSNFFKKIGISQDKNVNDFVDVTVDEKSKIITIKKNFNK